MKSLLPGALCCLLALSACRSGPPEDIDDARNPGSAHEVNHWNSVYHPIPGEEVGDRLLYHGFGYRSEVDGGFWGYEWRQFKDIWLTFQRHVFLDDPENPFLRENASGKVDMSDYDEDDVPEWEGVSR